MKVKELVEGSMPDYSSKNSIDKVKRDWDRIAKEAVTVEYMPGGFKSGSYYGFASELATLRLWKSYDGSKDKEQGYSKNYKSFYFRLDV